MDLRYLTPALVLTLAACAACSSAPPPPADGPAAASSAKPSASAAPSAAASAAPADSASADAPPADKDAPADEPPAEAPAKHVTAKLPKITWTKTPKIDDAPKTVAVADASGMPVEMALAAIERVSGEWRIEVGESKDLPFEERQSVTVYLKEPPKKGAKASVPFGSNRGYFQIKQANGKGTTSYNATNAWAIEFTSWDVKPYDKTKKGVQEAGHAKGRLIVMYELGEGYKNSWVAGTFDGPVTLWDAEDKPKPEKK